MCVTAEGGSPLVPIGLLEKTSPVPTFAVSAESSFENIRKLDGGAVNKFDAVSAVH
jgi:hypothetical protein